MKTKLMFIFALFIGALGLSLTAPAAYAGGGHILFNVHLGIPLAFPVVEYPPPVYYYPPVSYYPPVYHHSRGHGHKRGHSYKHHYKDHKYGQNRSYQGHKYSRDQKYGHDRYRKDDHPRTGFRDVVSDRKQYRHNR